MLRLALVLALAASGCTGNIGESSGRVAGGAGGDCRPSVGRVGLQRLTRAEYDRTVRDLFGVVSAPASAFPPDSATSGFDNNAASLGTSPQLTELLLDASELVAAEAMRNRRDEIVICDPAQQGEEPCARAIFEALALKIYRRPATAAEIDDLLPFVQLAATEGDTFETGIEWALRAMLVSPQFLFKNVPPLDLGGAAGDTVPLDGFALATRLSYFVWGSTPDDALLARAADGSLVHPDTLRDELDRLLADPRSSALYDGFVTQWLQLGKLAAATPDAALFPTFTEELRGHMLEETRLFFEDLRARDASPLEIVTGTRTFASEGLASLYGVAGVTGPTMQPITTDPAARAGVLTMPAILTMTAGPTHPNIVKRGVWLAETILCAAPPPPPDGVPPAPDPQPGETERERLARHRSDPSCASCHELIDPLGFTLEHYDAVGRWRDDADGVAVDPAGRMPDGTNVADVLDMAQRLESSDEFRTCISQKLVTYALGRVPTGDEQCVLSQMGATVTPDSTLSDLLWAVVASPAFRNEVIEGGP